MRYAMARDCIKFQNGKKFMDFIVFNIPNEIDPVYNWALWLKEMPTKKEKLLWSSELKHHQ